MSVKLQLKGVDGTIRELVKTDERVKAEITTAISSAQDIVRRRAEHYPRRRPSSKYDRTGKLGRGWASRKPTPFRGIVYNRVPYAGYVQGTEGSDDPDQAWMHKGRWPTTGKIVEELHQKITGMFEAAIKKAVR